MEQTKIESIIVYDDFFSESTQDEIINLLNRPRWSFTGGGGHSKFWHMEGLEEEEFFKDYLFKEICQKLGKNFKIERVYANGQTAGQSGVPHVDDGDWTFLYYPNKEWHAILNGALFFLEKTSQDDSFSLLQGEVIKTVSYKSNRGVLFSSKILHYADAPERHYHGLRVSLAYKMLCAT
jgi:hypothetical protein